MTACWQVRLSDRTRVKIRPQAGGKQSRRCSQRNLEDAARVAGIAPKTLVRWLKAPEFAQMSSDVRR